MAYLIVKDPDTGMAALVDPDAGWALGPVIHVPGDADQAQQLVEGFVGALGEDPATVSVFTLATHWEAFVSTIAGAQDAAPADQPPADQAGTPTGEQAAPPADQPAPEPAPAGTPAPAPDAPADPVLTPGQPTDPPPAPQPADTDQAGTPTTEQAAPGPCPNCDGFGTVAVDGVEQTCPTCNGTGQAPAAPPA